MTHCINLSNLLFNLASQIDEHNSRYPRYAEIIFGVSRAQFSF